MACGTRGPAERRLELRARAQAEPPVALPIPPAHSHSAAHDCIPMLCRPSILRGAQNGTSSPDSG